MKRTFRRWRRNIGELLEPLTGAVQASKLTGTLGGLACVLDAPGVPPSRRSSGILCYLSCSM